ncbi:MAG: undecaprenyl-diphosphate phosphatase [Halobacteria archaeon]
MVSIVVSIIIGLIQGVLEWLPVSSEGSTSLFLTAFTNVSPETSVKLALFLHAGTAVSALTYYRSEVWSLVSLLPEWRYSEAFEETPELAFLIAATVTSIVSGFTIYKLLIDVANALAGGVFISAIGGLLIITGLIQQRAETHSCDHRKEPGAIDAVLIGFLQGVAVLPGVSRSGTTVSALLLRDYEASVSLELSFLLSIPAAFGAGVLVVLETGGVPSMDPVVGATAFVVSAGVGYLTIDALVRVVERIRFWLVCLFFGGLAVIGGGIVFLV